MIDELLRVLAAWSRAAQAYPVRAGLIAMAVAVAMLVALGGLARARLELRSARVAAGPIFAGAGLVVLGLSLVWWLADAVLLWADQLLLEERLLLLLAPEGPDREAALRQLLALREGGRLILPGMVHVPLAFLAASAVYLGIVLWVGRTLAELTSLEQKPDDVLAKERAAQRKAIEQALAEGKPIPAEEVVSVPLADDRLGRIFKLLGHWTSVELVEERFVRWQRPLVDALTITLVLALPAALGGHVGAPLWVGAAIALDGLRRNLKTRPAAPEEPAADPAPKAAPSPPAPALGPLVEAVHAAAGPLTHAAPSPPAQGGQLSPGTDLSAKKVLEELRRELGLAGGLYVHQGLACDAFAARKNVLVTTPPLSGKQALLDLLVFYTLLVEAENVLYLARDAASATAAEDRFRKRADAARWRWNVSAANLAGRAGAVDVARAQPGLVFADPEAVHRELCGHQAEWQSFLGGLGVVIVPGIDAHAGARGAHLAHVLRRLRRAVDRAMPAVPSRAAAGERVRFLATATPLYRDLGRFAERVAGRPFHVVGPEVDGAPQSARAGFFLAAAPAPGRPSSDLHPAVQALGEALAQGFAAELLGYEGVLAATDVARANEVMLGRGVATRGRSVTASDASGDAGDALTRAQVVVARASASSYASLPKMACHVGFDAVAVPKARVAALGAGEHVGVAAAPGPPKPEEPPPPIEIDPATGQPLPPPPPPPPPPDQVLVLFQPDLDPFAALLAKERPPVFHPDLEVGCALVADPSAGEVQRAHLACALAEGPAKLDDLRRDFTAEVLASHLGERVVAPSTEAVAASELPWTTTAGQVVVAREERELDAATGSLRAVTTLQARGAEVHARVALDASGPATPVVDRHTGEVLFSLERERARSAAYPGRIFVHAGRRFTVMALEEQGDAVACEREERALTTSKMRRLALELVERRAGAARRGAPRDGDGAGERRAAPARSFGGARFTLEHARVEVVEEVLGLRRLGPDGASRDVTAYADPIRCRFATRAAVLGLPAASFGAISSGALHALTHLFRVTLPAFVHHREEDLEIAWLPSFGTAGAPALAFVDAHPGGVGFAEAVTLDVVRHVVRWSLALTRRCPRGCKDRTGCPGCLRIARCHAEPDRHDDLDKPGADRVLALLVGEAELAAFGG